MENLIYEGFKFMALGMGTVFSFLIILIVAMNLQSYIINKFFPEPIATPDSGSKNNNNKAKIAAISAAITHHKNVKG